MNPSYENGGQNIPGVKPGVIASGPDPVTPANPALVNPTPANPVSANPTPVNPTPANPGVIASGPTTEDVEPRPITTPSGLSLGSSRQPTGGRPMSISSMPMNDDIILSGNDAPSSNKKGLIIGGVIAGIVMVVLAVVMVIILNKGGGSSTANNADQNLFANYFDYLVNTEDFTVNQNSEYDEYKVYGVQEALNNKDTEYFEKLGSLWNNFYTNVKEENKYSEVSKIMGDIEYQNELMDFVTKYMATTVWNENGLLELYLKNGLEKASSEVEKNYKKLAETIYEPGKRFAEAIQKNANLYLTTFSKADAAGCIASGEINYDCVRNNAAKIYTSNESMSSEDFVSAEDGGGLAEDAVSSLSQFGFRINDDFREENTK